MQINNNIQNNVFLGQNQQVKKAEDEKIQDIKEQKQEETKAPKAHQEVLNHQDSLINNVNTNNQKEAQNDLENISKDLEQKNQRFANEDFSKLNHNFLRAHEDSFKNSQQVSIKQSQLAQLLA